MVSTLPPLIYSGRQATSIARKLSSLTNRLRTPGDQADYYSAARPD
jgi:hypothetical protein